MDHLMQVDSVSEDGNQLTVSILKNCTFKVVRFGQEGCVSASKLQVGDIILSIEEGRRLQGDK